MGFARRQPSTGSGARRYEKMWGFAPVLFAFQDIFARNIFRKWKIEIYSSGQNGDGFLISLLSSIWVRPTRPTRGTPIVKKNSKHSAESGVLSTGTGQMASAICLFCD